MGAAHTRHQAADELAAAVESLVAKYGTDAGQANHDLEVWGDVVALMMKRVPGSKEALKLALAELEPVGSPLGQHAKLPPLQLQRTLTAPSIDAAAPTEGAGDAATVPAEATEQAEEGPAGPGQERGDMSHRTAAVGDAPTKVLKLVGDTELMPFKAKRKLGTEELDPKQRQAMRVAEEREFDERMQRKKELEAERHRKAEEVLRTTGPAEPPQLSHQLGDKAMQVFGDKKLEEASRDFVAGVLNPKALKLVGDSKVLPGKAKQRLGGEELTPAQRAAMVTAEAEEKKQQEREFKLEQQRLMRNSEIATVDEEVLAAAKSSADNKALAKLGDAQLLPDQARKRLGSEELSPDVLRDMRAKETEEREARAKARAKEQKLLINATCLAKDDAQVIKQQKEQVSPKALALAGDEKLEHLARRQITRQMTATAKTFQLTGEVGFLPQKAQDRIGSATIDSGSRPTSPGHPPSPSRPGSAMPRIFRRN